MTFLLRDIADHLKGSTAILDDVGTNIFPDVIPQQQSWDKAIVLSEISQRPEYYMGGEAGEHTTQIQVDYYTKGTNGRYTANIGSELIRNRLSGYRGTFGTGCRGTARLLSCVPQANEPTDATDTWRFRVTMDFEILHTAATPDLT